MRTLKYAVLGIAPLLAAGGFAQGLSVGVKNDAFMQAQAGGPMGSDRPTNIPMSEDGKGNSNTASGSPAAMNQDKDKTSTSTPSDKGNSTPAQAGKQVRKDKKQQPKDSGG